MYQIIESLRGNVIVLAQDDVVLSFTEDHANTDYQAYLAWVADGNTPEPWNPDTP